MDDAENGFDLKDLPFRVSPNTATPALYSMVAGKAININSFNAASDTYDMPLVSKVGVSGTYKIDASGFDFVYEYKCIQLEDKLKHITVNLREQNTYTFEMQVGDSPNRFVIHFSKADECKSNSFNQLTHVDFANSVEVLPTATGSAIHFSFDETTAVTVEVMNVLGQPIIDPKTFTVSYSNEQLILPSDYSGMYIVKVQSEKGVVVKQFYKN